MIRRRAHYDPLGPCAGPRWLTIRTFSGGLIEARQLEPNADLVRTFLAAMLELIDAGWHLGEFSSTSAAVRHERGTEKRMLAIEAQDPEAGGRQVAWRGQCVHCED